MINKLLLVYAGAIWGGIAMLPVATISAQSKVSSANVSSQNNSKGKVTANASKKKPSASKVVTKPASKNQTAQVKVVAAPPKKLPHTAQDLKERRPETVSMPVAFNASNSIAIDTTPNENLIQLAQSGTATSNSADILRNELLIRPIDEQNGNVSVQRLFTPSLNAGTPIAFGLQTGDVFVGLFGSTAGKLRDTVDGSISLGAGLGDAREYLAVEGVYNINSIRRFASNGTFDLKVHRLLYEDFDKQVAAAVGWTNFANYGSDSGGTRSSVYGALSYSQFTDPLNLEDPKTLTATLGVGGGVYRKSTSNDGVGVFANLGYQFAPQWGASTAWSGQGLNFGLSFLPEPTVPLNVTLTYSDVTNNSDSGTQLILGITYGANYSRRR
ncbi:hypothetical protein [Pseudanabaena mucicola]|uniref:Uncharacterized protein n=1 Tax=Pseudanabaena mucicola FACHB-723 TaxID=2692860 RepID=A0ABR7ZV48_9CYAN|nr:hypothetical protein [Pseudanabaena mucicola]MBD2187853.1 hypothetical protein [Pseudanabaena mucicola FACHB-723]